MPTLLLNLRHVPDDEADDVRTLLEANDLPYYETAANRWGISAGAIWIRDDEPAQAAKILLAEYQATRRARARAEHAAAKSDGTAPRWWHALRDEPLRVLFIVIAIGCVIALSFWPLMLAGR